MSDNSLFPSVLKSYSVRSFIEGRSVLVVRKMSRYLSGIGQSSAVGTNNSVLGL